MKIITCASYGGSGSSALTDLVSEYENVYGIPEYEFRFLHDIDGISDLEFHLVECHNRHNSGHALKRYLRLVKFFVGTPFNSRYEPFFQNHWWEYSKEYVDSLIESRYKGWWFYDLYDKGTLYYYFKQVQNHLLRRIPSISKGIIPNEETYLSHPTEAEFLEKTRNYVSKLMNAANKDGSDYLEIDQIVPSQNIDRILRYFSDDIFVFVVDRDPRDIYVLEKYYWHSGVSYNNGPEEFCDWYEYVHLSGSKEQCNSKVAYIQFEDFVYNYEYVVDEVEKFTGLNSRNHTKKFIRMNPQRSIHNTQLWKKHPELNNDIKIIEKRLHNYLYDFNKYDSATIRGFNDGNKVF